MRSCLFIDVPRTCPKWSSGVLAEFEEARAGRSPSSSCLCPRCPAAALSEWLEPAIIKYRKHQQDLSFYHRHHIDEIYTNIVFTDNICCFIVVIIRILPWHWECWTECGGLPWVSSVPARCLHYQQIFCIIPPWSSSSIRSYLSQVPWSGDAGQQLDWGPDWRPRLQWQY